LKQSAGHHLQVMALDGLEVLDLAQNQIEVSICMPSYQSKARQLFTLCHS
jgi:hypothetical protein